MKKFLVCSLVFFFLNKNIYSSTVRVYAKNLKEEKQPLCQKEPKTSWEKIKHQRYFYKDQKLKRKLPRKNVSL